MASLSLCVTWCLPGCQVLPYCGALAGSDERPIGAMPAPGTGARWSALERARLAGSGGGRGHLCIPRPEGEAGVPPRPLARVADSPPAAIPTRRLNRRSPGRTKVTHDRRRTNRSPPRRMHTQAQLSGGPGPTALPRIPVHSGGRAQRVTVAGFLTVSSAAGGMPVRD